MKPLLDIGDLRVRFNGERTVHALNGVDLQLNQDETIALLGESGSGKSLTLRTLLRLMPARAAGSGRVAVGGQDVLAMSSRDLQRYRGLDVSMVFQDPALALNPVDRIGNQIAEVVRRKRGLSKAESKALALDMLRRVRIPSPEQRMLNYPHELSGGMKQRVMIALALACRPRLLLADEPTTALDATVQIQILLLLRELQHDFGMAVVFVTHDIGVAVEVADRIAVMYAGRIVEEGTTRDVIRSSRHPYTRALLAANLHGVPRGSRLEAIPGSPPVLDAPPAACAFAPRCPRVMARCTAEVPPAYSLGPRRRAACFLAAPESAGTEPAV